MSIHRNIDVYLEMPPEERRRLRFNIRRKKGKKRTAPYRKRILSNDDYTPEEVVDWVRDNNIRTWRELEGARKEGDPSTYRICELFGSWRSLRDLIWGGPRDRKKDPFAPGTDAEYIVKVIASFELWTWRKYKEARKRRPDIVPSECHVIHHFGRWSLAIYFAEKILAKGVIQSCMRFKKRNDRWPRISDCKNEGIDIGLLITIHGTKRKLDAFLDSMERIENENLNRG